MRLNFIADLFARRVFVSYSSHDNELVGAVVELIRLMKGGVFWAPDSIDPGTKWWPKIRRAICGARYVLVIWCRHSAESVHVKDEWAQAIACRRLLVPALLDDTELPSELQCYERIDLRALSRHSPNDLMRMQPDGRYAESMRGLATIDDVDASSRRRMRSLSYIGSTLGLALMLLAVARPFPPLPPQFAKFTTLVNVLVLLVGLISLLQSWFSTMSNRDDAHKAAVVDAEDGVLGQLIERQRTKVLQLLHEGHRAVQP